MKLSARAEYACLAVLELALWYHKEKLLQMKAISSKYGIPVKYLVQALTQLKNAGIVRSKRGIRGGYMLLKPPADITLADVIRTVEGTHVRMKISERAISDEKARKVFLGFKTSWQKVMDKIMELLKEVSFEDICKEIEGSEKEKSRNPFRGIGTGFTSRR